MSTPFVFVDTNILVQFVFGNIPWEKLAESTEVVLIVTPIVWREIEDHKIGDKERLRERARAASTQLIKLRKEKGKEPELRPGVRIRFDVQEPGPEAFAKYHLRETNDDNHLLAGLLAFRDQEDGRKVLLATEDGGLLIKAEGYGINVLTPDDSFRRVEEPGPKDKELRELRAKVATYPNLSIGLVGKGDAQFINVSKYAQPTLDEAAIEADHDTLRNLLSRNNEQLAWMKAKNLGTMLEKRHDQYLGVVQKFVVTLRKYWLAALKQRRRLSRLLRVDLELRNAGQGPAHGVKVHLFCEEGVRMLDRNLVHGGITSPTDPPMPLKAFPEIDQLHQKYRFQELKDWFENEHPADLVIASPREHRQSNGGYELRYAFDDVVVQGQTLRFFPLYLEFPTPEAVHSTNITWRVTAIEPPQSEEGSLNIVVAD